MSNTYNVNGTIVTLRPEYVEFHRRAHDDEISLFNADEIIDSVVSIGHPHAERVLKDYTQLLEYNLDANVPRMTRSEAGMQALITMIERAYGISYEGVENPYDEEVVTE